MVRRRGLALLSCWVLGGGGSGAHILSAAASPARAVDLSKACVHFAECPGCSVATQLDQPPVLARARDFFRSECDVADVPSIMGPGTGWRTHAKLAVRGRAGAPLIGLFKARSHEVLQIPQCAVHHPAINSAVAELSALMAEARTSVYDEPSHTGLVRYLQVSVERSSGKVQLALVCNAPPVPAAAAAGSEVAGPVAPRGLLPLLALLAERAALPASVWHSVWVHFNEERRNNIVCYLPAPAGTSRWLLVSGPPAVRERVHKRVFAFPPFIFRQANLDAFEGIAREVAESVTEGSRVTELYAGIGLLGLNCAERVLSVRCSDVNPNLEDAVGAALEHLPPELRARMHFARLDAAEAMGELSGADVLIVDPPRKGLDKALLSALCAARAGGGAAASIEQLCYVSCGYDALERDARALLAAGWRVRSARAHVLVPGANHIETVAIFDRCQTHG